MGREYQRKRRNAQIYALWDRGVWSTAPANHYPGLGLYSVLHCLSHTGKRDCNAAYNSTYNLQAKLIMPNMLNKLVFKNSIPEVN